MKNHRLLRRARRGLRGAELLQQLESRLLLSANVTAFVSNGLLYVQGDCANDNVLIDQASLAASQFRVASGDGATTINGTTAPAVFSGVDGLVITTGSGNDTVTVQNATVNAGISITGASGNQIVSLMNLTITGDLSLTNGGGQNATTVQASTVGGNLTVSAGAGFSGKCSSFWGDSHFANALETFSLLNSALANNLSITNTSGATTTDIESSSIGGNINVANGANSYGSSAYNYGAKHCGPGFNTAGDLFTLNLSSVNGAVTIANASDGNNTDIESSTIGADLSVTNNVVATGKRSFSLCAGANLANASDAFTFNASSVTGNVSLANISDGASATIEGNSTILGTLSINNGVGSYGQGYSFCANNHNYQGGDFLTISDSTIVSDVNVTNGSTYNSTTIDSSSLSGNLVVNDGLSLCTASYYSCRAAAGYAWTTDLFTLSNSTIAGSVAVTNASGYTATTITNSIVGADVIIADANGINYFTMDGSVIVGNLVFTAGCGITNVSVTNSLILSNATITVTNGATVVFDPTQVLGILTVTT